MKKFVHHPIYGKIEYNENLWSGKPSLYINGKALPEISKKVFQYEDTQITVKGNSLTSIVLLINGEEFTVVEKTKWYEMVFLVLMLSVGLVWGNSVALCNIFPVVGGAIGGGLCALFAMLSLSISKSTENVSRKLLIGAVFLGVTIVVCHVIALSLLSLVA